MENANSASSQEREERNVDLKGHKQEDKTTRCVSPGCDVEEKAE